MDTKKLKLIREKLDKITQFWFLGEPLLFACFCTHELKENPKLTVPFRTGKMRIEYNPELLVGRTDFQLRRLFEYEIIRILLKHPYLRKPEHFDAATAIIASDVTIAQDEIENYLEEEISVEHRLPRNRSFEEYYKLLMFSDAEYLMLGKDVYLKIPRRQYMIKRKFETEGGLNCGYNAHNRQIGQTEEKGVEGQEQKDGQHEVEPGCDNEEGTSNKNIENLPDHSENKDGFSEGAQPNGYVQASSEIEQMEAALNSPDGPTGLWDEDDVARELLNEMIRDKIANLDEWGPIGSRYKEKIIASLTAKIDYRKVLKNFRASILADSKNFTRFRPSRRNGFEFMGTKRNFTTRLLIAVDTSGSVDNPDLKNFLGVVNKFFKYGIKQIDLVYFDVDIKGNPER
ncbi:MAG: hypothetical protein Q4B64_10710, partial [Spirochaetales bacterium]|nr:hypothetical protein [Spirochaetales bacterium]